MVNYQCQRCGYTTINKTMFKRHLLRKNICLPKVKEVQRRKLLTINNLSNLAKNYGIDNTDLEEDENVGSKSMNLSENSSDSCNEIFIKDGKLKCSYCDKTFAKKEYLEKHMKKYCKMLIQFNNIYDFKNMKLGKDIYKDKNAGNIYIVQIDYLNYNYYKVGISNNIEQQLKDYRCENTYEPLLYYYIPCRNVKEIEKELNDGLSEFNVKREIFNGDVEKIKNKIISIVKNKYPGDDIKAYEPEIKIGDFSECHHCNKCFFNSSALYEHFKICDDYKETFNKYSNNKFKCKCCEKTFTTRQGKYKHMKYYCRKKKDNLDNNIIIKELRESNEELRESNQELKIMIEKLINSKTNINHGTINNANGDINTMNNIQINNYGSENIKYITDKVFKKLLTNPMSAITRLIELKHFHPEHPENHNVKITNIHDKYAKIYQDKKWLIKHKKNVVEDLVENGYADFEEFKDLNEDELAEKIKEKYALMHNNYHGNFEKICEEGELTLINESKNIDI